VVTRSLTADSRQHYTLGKAGNPKITGYYPTHAQSKMGK
jgi:hypothetical protein